MSSCKATAIKSFLFVCGWIRGRFVVYVLSAVVHPLLNPSENDDITGVLSKPTW